MGICPSSVRRPCRNYLKTSWAEFYQISVVACLVPYAHMGFEFFEKKKPRFPIFHIFIFSLTWDPMREEIQILLLPQTAYELVELPLKFLLK